MLRVLGFLTNHRIHSEPTLILPLKHQIISMVIFSFQLPAVLQLPKEMPQIYPFVLKAVCASSYGAGNGSFLSSCQDTWAQTQDSLSQDHSSGRHLLQLCNSFQKPTWPFKILSNLLNFSQSHSLLIYLLAILFPCEERAQFYLFIKLRKSWCKTDGGRGRQSWNSL